MKNSVFMKGLIAIFVLLLLSQKSGESETKKGGLQLQMCLKNAAAKLFKPFEDKIGDVFWFYIRVKHEEGKKEFQLVGTASRSETGDIKAFQRALWWGLTVGQLAIGPFWNDKEAKDARLLYRRSRKRTIKEEEGETSKREVHWFLVTFKERKRSPSFDLERMPARLASGSVDEFLDAMYEAMTFERMAVGTFWEYTEAENAKAFYRENE